MERLSVCHRALALQDVDVHSWAGCLLAVENDFALLGGDGGVGFNELGHDPAHGLDAEGQRCHVQQKNVCDVTTQDSALDGGTYGHHFVGIHLFGGLFSEERSHGFLNGRDSG